MQARQIAPLILVAGAAVIAAQQPVPVPRSDRPATIEDFMKLDRRIRVIAHRGFSARAPENTLVAIRGAISVGADMVEVDVTSSREGEVVCIHDETLDRTTNGSGPVVAQTLEQLKALDAGSWFDRRFRGEPIPTLTEILETVQGKILLNIEIKREAVTPQIKGGFVEAVAMLVVDHDMAEQVVVSSFEPLALEQMHEIAPRINTTSLFDVDLHRDQHPLDILAAASSTGLNLSRDRVTRDIVEACHRHGFPVGVYTVNSERQMRRMMSLGVHAVFTDHPDLLLQMLADKDEEFEPHYPPVAEPQTQPGGRPSTGGIPGTMGRPTPPAYPGVPTPGP